MRQVAVALALVVVARSAVAQRADTLPAKASRDSVERQISALRKDPEGTRLPKQDSISMGPRTVASGTVERGPVATAGGNLDVFGTVDGDAIAIGGDVIVHHGGVVKGTALAAFGRVQLDGGTVDGEMRSLNGAVGVIPAASATTTVPSTSHALSLALGWLGVLWLISIGVLLFAGNYLDGVVEALQSGFWSSFGLGLASQLALAPALLLLVVALALTILGILLIPFAIVAFVLATAGLVTIGFLAVARLTGESLGRKAARRLSARGAALRALIVGVSFFMAFWLVAAAFSWTPAPVTGALRALALAVTWVAATAGLGAAVRSRGGMRRAHDEVSRVPQASDVAWQTPTPVTGVVAARRPAGTATRSRS